MRRWLALLLLLVAPAWAATPEPSPDELRFITANAEFTLLHEMGHLLISELQLPVLGREEDAADQLGFMGLFLLVLNALMIMLVAWMLPGFHVAGFWSGVGAAIITGVVSWIAAIVIGDTRQQPL